MNITNDPYAPNAAYQSIFVPGKTAYAPPAGKTGGTGGSAVTADEIKEADFMINGVKGDMCIELMYYANTKQASADLERGLNAKEAEIFNKIREIISSEIGADVELNKGREYEGRFLAVIGFWGGQTPETRSPFFLPPHILTEMAADKGVYNEWMASFKEMVKRQKDTEAQLAQSTAAVKAAEQEQKNQKDRFAFMDIADFWQKESRPVNTNLIIKPETAKHIISEKYQAAFRYITK